MHFQYNIFIWVLPIKSCIRVASNARDGGFPQNKNLPLNFSKEWGAEFLNPLVWQKLYTAFSICIECPLFSRQNPHFLWYWFPLKIGNLDTNLLYVCEHIWFSVQNELLFIVFNIVNSINISFYTAMGILLSITKSSYKLLFTILLGKGGGLNLDVGNQIFIGVVSIWCVCRVTYSVVIWYARRVSYSVGIWCACRVTYSVGIWYAHHVTYAVGIGYVRRVAYAEGIYKAWHVSYFVGI